MAKHQNYITTIISIMYMQILKVIKTISGWIVDNTIFRLIDIFVARELNKTIKR